MNTITRYELRLTPVDLIAAREVCPEYAAEVHDDRRAAEIARRLIGSAGRECFIALLVDIKNRVIGYTEVGLGAVDSCPVDVRAVFQAAVHVGASGIIVAHNHPSGVVVPSEEDIALTTRLLEAGRLLGIPLIDHVIVTVDACYSMRANSKGGF